MDFLSSQEKIKLHQVLVKSSQLHTSYSRNNFLQLCDLDKYCNSVQMADSSDKFSISIYNQLSQNYVNNGEKLALIVFLEYLIELDSSLSQEDKQFIEYLISKDSQKFKINFQPKSCSKLEKLLKAHIT